MEPKVFIINFINLYFICAFVCEVSDTYRMPVPQGRQVLLEEMTASKHLNEIHHSGEQLVQKTQNMKQIPRNTKYMIRKRGQRDTAHSGGVGNFLEEVIAAEGSGNVEQYNGNLSLSTVNNGTTLVTTSSSWSNFTGTASSPRAFTTSETLKSSSAIPSGPLTTSSLASGPLNTSTTVPSKATENTQASGLYTNSPNNSSSKTVSYLEEDDNNITTPVVTINKTFTDKLRTSSTFPASKFSNVTVTTIKTIPVVTTPEPSSTISMVTTPEPSPEISLATTPEPAITISMVTTPEPSPKISLVTSPEPSPTIPMVTTPEPSPTISKVTTPEPSSSISIVTMPEPSTSPEPSPTISMVTTPEPSSSISIFTMPEPSTSPEPSPTVSMVTAPEPSHTTEPPASISATPYPETVYPEPSPETTKPEPEPTSDEPSAFAEPVPDWKIAKAEWSGAWDFHIYFFAAAFSILGAFCMISLIRLWRMHHLLSRHYFLSLNILVIAMCVLRVVYLLVDAYNSKNVFHSVLNYLLYSTAFPCLTSAFCILFYALLLATRMQIMSARIQKLTVIAGIIVFHFCLSLITDVVVGLFSEAYALLFICQLFFIVWGVLLFVGYMYIFRRLYSAAVKRQKSMADALNKLQQGAPVTKYTLGLSVKVALLAAILGLVCVGLELYASLGVYGRYYLYQHKPEPWPWWIYQSLLRFTEFSMCLIIAYIATQPFKYSPRKEQRGMWFYLLPCIQVCWRFDSGGDSPSEVSWNSTQGGYMLETTDAKRIKKAKAKQKSKVVDGSVTKSKNGKPALRRVSMLVIEEGFIRFRTEAEIERRAEAMSMGDLSNGNTVPDSNGPVSDKAHSGVLNNGFTVTDEKSACDKVELASSGSCDPAGLTSVGSDLGSITASMDLFSPPSGFDLAASMENELDRVFHKSFEEDAESVKSLPLEVTPSTDHMLANCRRDRANCVHCRTLSSESGSLRLASPNRTLFASPESPSKKPLLRRCRSDESKHNVKTCYCDSVRYYSLADIDSVNQTQNQISPTEQPNSVWY